MDGYTEEIAERFENTEDDQLENELVGNMSAILPTRLSSLWVHL